MLTAPGVVPGRDVRQTGEDYARSEIVLAAGHRGTSAPTVGVIASCGWDGAFCRRQPRVAVISTGDELVSPGQAPDSGRVVDSNRLAIAAAVQAAGGIIEWTRWVPDDATELETAIADGTGAALDLLITCGGASVGDHDHTRGALRSVGARCVVDGIAMRPGRPTALELLGETRVLVLPGPPAAAVVVFHLLGRDLLGCGGGPRHRSPFTIARPGAWTSSFAVGRRRTGSCHSQPRDQRRWQAWPAPTHSPGSRGGAPALPPAPTCR